MDTTPLSPLTNGIFSDLLEAQTRLRDEAEEKWHASKEFIHSIARQVAPDWLNEQQKQGKELGRIEIGVLQAVIRERIASSAALSQSGSIPDPNQVQNLKEANRQIAGELEKAITENQLLQQSLTQNQQELARLREALEQAKRSPGSSIDFDLFPQWYQDWQNGNPKRDGAVLRAICENGLARQPEIFVQAAQILGINTNSGALTNAVDSLVKHGFVTVRKGDAQSVGQPPNIITLTPLGEAAYVFFAKAKAKPSELNLAAHKNDAHALRVLKASDLLREIGYITLRQGEQIKLEGNHLFNPDITAEKNGKTIYVEVERDSTKGNQDREAKWRNFFQASGGEMYFFCENAKVQERILTELNQALQEKKQLASLYFCDMSKMSLEVFEKTGSIWTTMYPKQP